MAAEEGMVRLATSNAESTGGAEKVVLNSAEAVRNQNVVLEGLGYFFQGGPLTQFFIEESREELHSI